MLSMIISKLKNMQVQLQTSDNGTTFKEKLIYAYKTQLIATLLGAWNADAAQCAENLKAILKNNWARIRGTVLCYTAQPNDALTLVLCELAQAIADEKTASLHILMPGIYAESTHEAYPNLIGDEAPCLPAILNTHILSNSGTYLLPVSLLSELTLPHDPNSKMFNPYYDYHDEVGNNSIIHPSEWHRLFAHSDETQTLKESKGDYENAIKKDSLLLQLNQLVAFLHINSAHGGTGTQEDTAEGGYWAIIRFKPYWDLLEEKKNLIPKELRDEIELLLDLSMNPQRNHTATEQLETCTGTRQEKLKPLIYKHQLILNEIGIDKDKANGLLESSKKHFDEKKESMQKQIAESKYQGKDALGITKELLKHFNIPVHADIAAEFNDLMHCEPDEIRAILSDNDDLQQEILAQWEDVGDFVLFVINTLPQRLQVVMDFLGKEFVEQNVNKTDHMIACLSLLSGENLPIVAKMLIENSKMESEDLISLFQGLNDEQKESVIQYYPKEAWATIFKGQPYQMLDLLKTLSLNSIRVILSALPDKAWKKFLKSRYHFNEILQSLSPDRVELLLSLMPNACWFNLIEDCYDFSSVLNDVNSEKRDLIIEHFPLEGYIKLIADSNAFQVIRFLPSLPVEKSSLILQHLPFEHLRTLLFGSGDLSNLLEPYSLEQSRLIIKGFPDTFWQKLIQNKWSLKVMLKKMSLDKIRIITERFSTEHWSETLSNTYDVLSLINELTEQQGDLILQAIPTALWPKIVTKFTDIGALEKHFSPAQRNFIIQVIPTEHWSTLIIDKYELRYILKTLPLEQGRLMMQQFSVEHWLKIFPHRNVFRHLLNLLRNENEQAEAIFECIPAAYWSKIVENGYQLAELLPPLTLTQRGVVVKALNNPENPFVKDAWQFSRVAPYLSEVQRAEILNNMHGLFSYPASRMLQYYYGHSAPQESNESGHAVKKRSADTSTEEGPQAKRKKGAAARLRLPHMP